MQVVNVLLCRSDRESVIRKGFFSNKLIFAGVGAEIALIFLIVYTPWGNALIGTAPLPLAAWLVVLPFAAGLFILEELRKRILRNTSSLSPHAELAWSKPG
jgi:sodium/potassium-transporting ATPase subunit alpha